MANTEVVFKRIVTKASEPLVLDLYRRILADRHPASTGMSMDGKLKSWRDLLLQIRHEGLLNRSESAAILKWARQKQHLFGRTFLPRRHRKAPPSWKSAVLP